MPSSPFFQFLGGLTFFFFGLYTINQGLQFFAGDRLKNIIARTTEGPLKSLFAGMVVTFFLQSSSAVTVMTSALAGSGLITLEQAMAIALGAGIGTTLVVFLISIKSIIASGMVLIAMGFGIRLLAQRQFFKVLGEVILGFGFVFFGLLVMSEATTPLKNYEWMPQVFLFLEEHRFMTFLGAAVITAMVHSSGVVLGVAISLAYGGAMTFSAAFPLVLGANLGTSFTAIMTTWFSPADAKRAALANLLLRTGGVLLIFPFMDYAVRWIQGLSEIVLVSFFKTTLTVHAEIALSHFFFNLLVAILFLPFIPAGKKLVVWLVPSRKEAEVFGPKYLDKNALSTPSLAFAQATRELTRMGEIVVGMFEDSLSLFLKYDHDKVAEIESRDHKVDTLYKATKFYLARLSLANLKEEEAETELHLITAANELENIGDTIDRHLLRLAHKKWNKGAEFSDEGWKEISELHRGACEMMNLAMAAFSSSSEELAQKMIHHQTYYNDREDQLKMSHLVRLHQGLKESIETSAIHLELLSLFHRVNLSLLTMVSYLLPEREKRAGMVE